MEMLIYMALLVSLTLFTVTALISMSSSYRNFKAVRDAQISASTAIERVSREIKLSSSVNVSESVFNTHPGVLKMNTFTGAGASTTIEFYLVNERLFVKEGSVETGALNASTTQIKKLIFRRIPTTRSEAVRIEMDIEGAYGSTTKRISFTSTSVLRNAYESQ